MLAERLDGYRRDNVAVLVVSNGGVVIGNEIAKALMAPLVLLLTKLISPPGEPSLVLGSIDQEGNFMVNSDIEAGFMEEYLQEFHGYLEEEKMRKFFMLNEELVAYHGTIDVDRLKYRDIIIATDGAVSSVALEAAINFLKPVPTGRIIIAMAVAPAQVVTKLEPECDDFVYLYLPDNFISVDHYFENNDKPTKTEVMQMLRQSEEEVRVV